VDREDWGRGREKHCIKLKSDREKGKRKHFGSGTKAFEVQNFVLDPALRRRINLQL
jgi:hypothetical protein